MGVVQQTHILAAVGSSCFFLVSWIENVHVVSILPDVFLHLYMNKDLLLEKTVAELKNFLNQNFRKQQILSNICLQKVRIA